MEWSKKQQKIIDLRNTSLLVAAAAGSGKTAVLVERIIQLMTDPKSPLPAEKMVVVTFAREAAQEMKTRIQEGLEKRLEKEPSNEWLATQAVHINHANISTIHSFCQKIIKDYFYEIDVSPSFKIAKEEEIQLIKKDALDLIINEIFQEILSLDNLDQIKDEDEEYYHYLVENKEKIRYCQKFVDQCTEGRDQRKVEEFIQKVYEISISYPWPKEWFEESINKLDIDDIENLPGIKEYLDGQYQLIQSLKEIAKENYKMTMMADGLGEYEGVAEADSQLLESLGENPNYNAFKAFLENIKFKAMPRIKSEFINEELKIIFKNNREKIKDVLNGISEDFVFSKEEQLSFIKENQILLKGLLYLVERYMNQFEKIKNQKDILDFNDLEHLALKALVERCKSSDEGARKKEDFYWRPTRIARDLATQVQEIFIDEYQDSNLLQELILESISGEGKNRQNLFTVGDVKQSIYRFRQARPELFTARYKAYQDEGDQIKIDLHQNFRSRACVLESINEICYPLMKSDIGNIDYDEKAALHPGATYLEETELLGKKSEIILIEEDKELGSKAELEANWIGNKILELIDQEIICYRYKDENNEDQLAYRKAKFSDMVILLRSRTYGEEYQKVLKSMNIPVQMEVKSGYFSSIEVVTLLNYLSFLGNELQDIPLASLLKSGMVSLSDEDLANIRLFSPSDSFAKSFQLYMESNEPKPDTLINFYRLVRKQRLYLSYSTIYNLLEEVLRETGYRFYLQGLPHGESRLANIEMLMSQSLQFEKMGGQGIFDFLKYIEKMNKYDIDMAISDPLQGEENVVRIMTIHKSKGLEFPIVFLGALGQGFNEMDLKGDLLADMDLGISIDFKDRDKFIKYESIFKTIIKDRIQIQNLGEEMRVLYVALTRAKEKLYMIGTLKKVDEELRKWDAGHNYLSRRKPRHYLDWIMPSVLKSNSNTLDYNVVVLDEVYQEDQDRLSLSHQNLSDIYETAAVFDAEIKRDILKIKDFKYSYDYAVDLPIKVSIQELTHKDGLKKDMEIIPSFMKDHEKKELSIEKGNTYHKIFEKLPAYLMANYQGENLDSWIESFFENKVQEVLINMVENGLIEESLLPEVKLEKISVFFKSKLGNRILKAYLRNQLYQEDSFMVALPFNEINEELESLEEVILQGVIDIWFEEDNGITIVDFKTDYVPNKDESALIERYKGQLDIYRKALLKITNLPIKDVFIYSVYLDREISINLS